MLHVRIRAARRRRFAYLEDAAAALGLTREAYYAIECGQRTPDPDLLTRIADLFGVDLNWLVADRNPSH